MKIDWVFIIMLILIVYMASQYYKITRHINKYKISDPSQKYKYTRNTEFDEIYNRYGISQSRWRALFDFCYNICLDGTLDPREKAEKIWSEADSIEELLILISVTFAVIGNKIWYDKLHDKLREKEEKK